MESEKKTAYFLSHLAHAKHFALWWLFAMLFLFSPSLDAEETKRNTNFFDRHTQYIERRNQDKRKAIKELSNFEGTNLFYLSDNELYKLKHIITDIRHKEFLPTYICKLINPADEKKFTVLFESPIGSLNSGKWNLSIFNDTGNSPCWSFPFRSFLDDVVTDCSTTNCFKSASADTLKVDFNFSRNVHNKGTPLSVYFSLSADPILTRIESKQKLEAIYFPIRGIKEDRFMGSVIQQPFLFLEYDIEQAFKTSSSAEILNLFIYFNSKKLDGFQEDLNELHKSKRMQRAVEKLMKHEHPWVREAANYYLVNFGIFKE